MAKARKKAATSQKQKARKQIARPSLSRRRPFASKTRIASKKTYLQKIKSKIKESKLATSRKLAKTKKIGLSVNARRKLKVRKTGLANEFWRMNAMISAEMEKIEKKYEDIGIQRPTVNMQPMLHAKVGTELKGLEKDIRQGRVVVRSKEEEEELEEKGEI